MKVNFLVTLLDVREKEIPYVSNEFLTLKAAAIDALISQMDNEKIEAREKRRRTHLADEIWASKGVMEISRDDLNLIKEQIDRLFKGSLIYTRCTDFIEEAEKEDEKLKAKEKIDEKSIGKSDNTVKV